MYERSVQFNGHTMKGLIDSGSSCTLLRASVANRYKLLVTVVANTILRGFASQLSSSCKTTAIDVQAAEVTALVNA